VVSREETRPMNLMLFGAIGFTLVAALFWAGWWYS
jgi:hypothetical protein